MAATAPLARLGWDPGWASAFEPFGAEGRLPARVLAAHRDAWVVATADGDRDAVMSGRLRHAAAGPGDLPAVGDWVAVSGSDPVVIGAVLPRRTAFRRSAGEERAAGNVGAEQVLAANVDLALVVAGMDADFNLRRLERYLAVAWAGGTTPVILLNKADLPGDAAGAHAAAEAVAPGVEVRSLSALTGTGVAELAADHLRPGRTAVVLGSSGVGKSTLVNALTAGGQTTGAVHELSGRGRHTTTTATWLDTPDGGALIDLPGIRSFSLAGIEPSDLRHAFADVADAAERCRFRDCRHVGEAGCAVAEAVDPARLASYRKLLAELEEG